MGVFSEVAERFQGLQAPPEAGQKPACPSMNDLLLALSKAMDLLEGKPLRSAMKVAVIAGSIAKMMQLPQREVTSVVYAALLHDIGLARVMADVYPHLPPGVSEKQLFVMHALLNARVVGTPYERPLSPDLSQIMAQHPQAAADLIGRLHLSTDVAELVAAHHELCDGTGYPFGLSKEQIPLGARILTFADVVEGVMAEVTGLTSRRHALDSFLEVKTADKFDPDVVAVFQEIVNTHEDFLRGIATLEVEAMARCLMPERTKPIGSDALLDIASAMGTLSDGTMPLYKAERSQNMARLAVQLAEHLGIHREQCGELVLAAMLMDLGHVATPIGLLHKAAPLTAEERSVVQDHVVHTQDILKGLPGFENILLWASEHQERMNGKGYPGHKKGYEISVGGRILGLADVFDALTHPRPFRNHAHAPMDALPVIGQGRMTLYDNQLVNVLRAVVLSMDVMVPH